MQYLVYDPHYDPKNAAPATPELMTEMGKFVQEAVQAGALVATGALEAQGKRLQYADGKFTLSDSPSIELKELMGGWAVIRADSFEEATEWTKRFRQIVGAGESEIVRVYGPEG